MTLIRKILNFISTESILLLRGSDHFYDGIILACVQNRIKEGFYLSKIT